MSEHHPARCPAEAQDDEPLGRAPVIRRQVLDEWRAEVEEAMIHRQLREELYER